ncbi:hypothetical protein [Cupriavidus basilensis]|uniref:hypothetical protein n=1 Tax=Cupriavidus basilensis TaxID=68895 RepID=UPI0018CE380F|nr:hypothetical protein [Cupriavidus basilensis]
MQRAERGPAALGDRGREPATDGIIGRGSRGEQRLELIERALLALAPGLAGGRVFAGRWVKQRVPDGLAPAARRRGCRTLHAPNTARDVDRTALPWLSSVCGGAGRPGCGPGRQAAHAAGELLGNPVHGRARHAQVFPCIKIAVGQASEIDALEHAAAKREVVRAQQAGRRDRSALASAHRCGTVCAAARSSRWRVGIGSADGGVGHGKFSNSEGFDGTPVAQFPSLKLLSR